MPKREVDFKIKRTHEISSKIKAQLYLKRPKTFDKDDRLSKSEKVAEYHHVIMKVKDPNCKVNGYKQAYDLTTATKTFAF